VLLSEAWRPRNGTLFTLDCTTRRILRNDGTRMAPVVKGTHPKEEQVLKGMQNIYKMKNSKQ